MNGNLCHTTAVSFSTSPTPSPPSSSAAKYKSIPKSSFSEPPRLRRVRTPRQPSPLLFDTPTAVSFPASTVNAVDPTPTSAKRRLSSLSAPMFPSSPRLNVAEMSHSPPPAKRLRSSSFPLTIRPTNPSLPHLLPSISSSSCDLPPPLPSVPLALRSPETVTLRFDGDVSLDTVTVSSPPSRCYDPYGCLDPVRLSFHPFLADKDGGRLLRVSRGAEALMRGFTFRQHVFQPVGLSSLLG